MLNLGVNYDNIGGIIFNLFYQCYMYLQKTFLLDNWLMIEPFYNTWMIATACDDMNVMFAVVKEWMHAYV